VLLRLTLRGLLVLLRSLLTRLPRLAGFARLSRLTRFPRFACLTGLARFTRFERHTLRLEVSLTTRVPLATGVSLPARITLSV
jgi:hypothetical protein